MRGGYTAAMPTMRTFTIPNDPQTRYQGPAPLVAFPVRGLNQERTDTSPHNVVPNPALWTATLTVGSFSTDRLGRNATEGTLTPLAMTLDENTVTVRELYHDDSEDRIVVAVTNGSQASRLHGRWLKIGDLDPFELRRQGTTTMVSGADAVSGYDESDPWEEDDELSVKLYEDNPELDTTLAGDPVWQGTLTVGESSDAEGYDSTGTAFGSLDDTVLVIDGNRHTITGLSFMLDDLRYYVYTSSETSEAALQNLWLKVGTTDATKLGSRNSGSRSGVNGLAAAETPWDAAGDLIVCGLYAEDPDS